jgi:ABC-type bacteriocin/lantibiotic exporter with double-glycine peptidase domain
VLSLLAPYTYGIRKFFVLSFLFSIAGVGLAFLTPRVYRLFIDEVVVQGQMNTFFIVVAGYLFIWLTSSAADYAKNYVNNRFNNRLYFLIKTKLFGDLLKEDFSSYHRISVGEMKVNIESDTEFVKDFTQTQMIMYAIAWMSMAVSIVLLFFVSWKLTLIALLTIPFTLMLNNFISKREKVVTGLDRDNERALSTWFNTSLKNWKEIKALNLERYEKRQYTRFLKTFATLHARAMILWVFRAFIIPYVRESLLMQLLLYFVGGILIIHGQMTIGMLLMFVMYYGILSDSIKKIANKNADLKSKQPVVDKVLDKLGIKHHPYPKNQYPELTKINIEQVSFAYDSADRYILNNVNLTIHRGDRIAIHGKSGEGKSTLVQLITGIRKPTEGSIRFSDEPLHEIKPKVLYSKIGFIMQDSILFNVSIREYMLMAKPAATIDEMQTVLRKTKMDEFICSLPLQYDTVLGEGGVKLSGGQKQRLLLAGQLLRNAEILVLDEATNHLDPHAEDEIYTVLGALGDDKTIIMINHRESVLNICNREWLVIDGKVLELRK